jgi:signal transduction histidine kinase
MGAAAVWSVYRLATRSRARAFEFADFGQTLATCAGIPLLVSDPHFYTSNNAPVAIAGTAVISFSISLPAKLSLPMTLGISAAYANGAAAVTGWPHVVEIFNLYYFAFQWATATSIRSWILRVAVAVDTARTDRHAAELAEHLATAVADYDREQLRLLHDTVASTLLMIAHDDALPADRLAAQAHRDLTVLDYHLQPAPPPHVDLVSTLYQAGRHTNTPVLFTGQTALWVEGTIGTAIGAAAREAITNADRHSHADSITVHVDPDRIEISDNGSGFDASIAHNGTGIRHSIEARVHRIGGTTRINSTPQGTTVEISWPVLKAATTAEDPDDPDLLIERTRIGYSLALTGYAIANLALMVPPAAQSDTHPATQYVLAMLSALATASALPSVFGKRWWPSCPAITLLFAVTLLHDLQLAPAQLATHTQWTQATIGWCLIPLILLLPLRTATVTLCGAWIAMAATDLARTPSPHMIANIGLGTASILTVQLLAIIFYSLIDRAAGQARKQSEARAQATAREATATALQAEHRRRYSQRADNIRPLLTTLSHGQPVSDEQREHAHREYQQLRALFDQNHCNDHPLIEALHPAIERANRRGVAVTLHTDAKLPPVTASQIENLTTALPQLISAATTSARITLTCNIDGTLDTSIVATGVRNAQTVAAALPDTAELSTTILHDTVWLTTHYPSSTGDNSP